MITQREHAELITFTGGVPVGKIHRTQRAGYRRTVLELGGNAPLIVMEDADLDEAPRTWPSLGGDQELGTAVHGGQARALPRQSIGGEFAALVAEKAAKQMRYGRPDADPETDMSVP